MTTRVREHLEKGMACLNRLLGDTPTLNTIEAAGQAMAHCLKGGGRVFSCGNGGSMCDAMHFAEELSGRFRENRPALAAVAISDPGYISCAANDFGYEFIFSRYLEAHARAGDVLLAISTSGNSKNVLNAASWCQKNGVTVVALTGRKGSKLGEQSPYEIACEGEKYADLVQEMHIKVIHILISLIESSIFTNPS